MTSTKTATCNYASYVAAASAVTGKNHAKNKWITEDGYNLAAFEQTVGAWQIQLPLPLPKWKAEPKKVLTVENVINLTLFQTKTLFIFFFDIRYANTKTLLH